MRLAGPPGSCRAVSVAQRQKPPALLPSPKCHFLRLRWLGDAWGGSPGALERGRPCVRGAWPARVGGLALGSLRAVRCRAIPSSLWALEPRSSLEGHLEPLGPWPPGHPGVTLPRGCSPFHPPSQQTEGRANRGLGAPEQRGPREPHESRSARGCRSPGLPEARSRCLCAQGAPDSDQCPWSGDRIGVRSQTRPERGQEPPFLAPVSPCEQ